MSDLSKESLEASGGVGAPAEMLDSDKIESPEENANKEMKNDPCWEGYEMIGMKVVNGEEVPNCVPVDASNSRDWANFLLYEELEDMALEFNTQVGLSRAVDLSTLEHVANRAVDKYSYLEAREVPNAIRWDVLGFLEYSTLGLTASAEFDSAYADLLNAGHPYNSESSVEEYADWVSGAPGIDETSREAIVASIVPSTDFTKVLHASTRVKALIAGGQLPEHTVAQISEAVLWAVTED